MPAKLLPRHSGSKRRKELPVLPQLDARPVPPLDSAADPRVARHPDRPRGMREEAPMRRLGLVAVAVAAAALGMRRRRWVAGRGTGRARACRRRCAGPWRHRRGLSSPRAASRRAIRCRSWARWSSPTARATPRWRCSRSRWRIARSPSSASRRPTSRGIAWTLSVRPAGIAGDRRGARGDRPGRHASGDLPHRRERAVPAELPPGAGSGAAWSCPCATWRRGWRAGRSRSTGCPRSRPGSTTDPILTYQAQGRGRPEDPLDLVRQSAGHRRVRR